MKKIKGRKKCYRMNLGWVIYLSTSITTPINCQFATVTSQQIENSLRQLCALLGVLCLASRTTLDAQWVLIKCVPNESITGWDYQRLENGAYLDWRLFCHFSPLLNCSLVILPLVTHTCNVFSHRVSYTVLSDWSRPPTITYLFHLVFSLVFRELMRYWNI